MHASVKKRAYRLGLPTSATCHHCLLDLCVVARYIAGSTTPSPARLRLVVLILSNMCLVSLGVIAVPNLVAHLASLATGVVVAVLQHVLLIEGIAFFFFHSGSFSRCHDLTSRLRIRAAHSSSLRSSFPLVAVHAAFDSVLHNLESPCHMRVQIK